MFIYSFVGGKCFITVGGRGQDDGGLFTMTGYTIEEVLLRIAADIAFYPYLGGEFKGYVVSPYALLSTAEQYSWRESRSDGLPYHLKSGRYSRLFVYSPSTFGELIAVTRCRSCSITIEFGDREVCLIPRLDCLIITNCSDFVVPAIMRAVGFLGLTAIEETAGADDGEEDDGVPCRAAESDGA